MDVLSSLYTSIFYSPLLQKNNEIEEKIQKIKLILLILTEWGIKEEFLLKNQKIEPIKVPMKFLETKIPPPFLFLITAEIVDFFYSTFPVFVFSYQKLLALVLSLISFCFASTALVHFKKHNTTVNPLNPAKTSSLVVTGPYRFSRNPMYLALSNLLLALSLYFGAWLGLVIIPFFMTYVYFFQIVPEDKAMHKKYGADFLAYSKRVRCWI